MHERLVEDWLTKANERSFQTPFAQSLLAEGMEVLRLGHSPHEHGKDIIARDRSGKIHAYQLKDGGMDLRAFEMGLGQISALVETQVEHPAISRHPQHQPWLVLTGELSHPVEDRIRVQNNAWRKRKYTPLKVITGRQLCARFTKMATGFWPEKPQSSHRLFSLYLADGNGNLDLDSFAQLIATPAAENHEVPASGLRRRLAVVNLFASYALSPFYAARNHWELVQGWTIAAAQIAWIAEVNGLAPNTWRPTFVLAIEAALRELRELADESLQPNAIRPASFCELDQITRSRCTICAGAIAVRLLIERHRGENWRKEKVAKCVLEDWFSTGRLFLWGESAVPLLLAVVWAMDQLRPDNFADQILFAVLHSIARQNSKLSSPRLPNPYETADQANAEALRRVFASDRQTDLQATTSYTLDAIVMIVARRMWRNALAISWPNVTKIDLIRLVPEKPSDLLIWRWGHDRGMEQSRKFDAPQSWLALLDDARRDQSDSLPAVLRRDLAFALLFMLCFPHRLSGALAKHLENQLRFV